MISWFYCHIQIIIDVIGNIILFASVAFLIGKAVWQWDSSAFFTDKKNIVKRRLDERAEPIVKILLLIWATRLRIIYVIFALVISGYLFTIFVSLSDQFLNIASLKPEAVRNLAIAFIGTTSGLGALFGIYLAILKSETNERQTYTDEQGLITDRINKAIERLNTNDKNGLPIIEVRLGALYALERIAQDSIRDHIQIMDILCAYVKTNSPLPKKATPPSKDIQVAVKIIGWRGNGIEGKKRLRKEKQKKYFIDLSYCDLNGLIFNKMDLSRALFYYSNFDKAKFYETTMKSARFDYAELNDVRIEKTDITNGSFRSAEIIHSLFSVSNLTNASFFQANLSKSYIGNRVSLCNASLADANMSNMEIANADMTNVRLDKANLKDATISATNLNNTIFRDIDMENVDLRDSYIYDSNDSFLNRNLFTEKQLDTMFCGIDVEILKNLKKRPKHWPTKKLHKDSFMKAYWNWRREAPTNYDPEYSVNHFTTIPHGMF